MKIERLGNCHLRYTLNDGTVREIFGGVDYLDARERDLRDASGQLVIHGPTRPVDNAAPTKVVGVEPLPLPTMNFDTLEVGNPTPGLNEGHFTASKPTPHYAGAAGAVESLPLPAMNFDRPTTNGPKPTPAKGQAENRQDNPLILPLPSWSS